MAHELRTPLSGVRAEAEFALSHAAQRRELRAALEQVLAGTDRMAAVIDTLLVAARREGAGPLGSSDAARDRALARRGPDVRVVAPRRQRARRRRPGARRRRAAPAARERASATPATRSRSSSRATGGEVVVSVSNDGEAIPPETQSGSSPRA